MNRTVTLPAEWTSKIRGLGLEEATRFLPLVTGVAAVASVCLVALKVWRTPRFEHFEIVTALALSAVAVSLILRTLLRRLTSSRREWVGAAGATSWLLALELGILLLVIPVLLVAKGTPEDEMTGWTWPLVNKRWLLALYNLAIATFIVFPVAIARWRSGSAPLEGPTARVAEPRDARKSWLLLVVGQVAIFALCWYLAGPPWHLERHHRSIEWHEQVHFGALQAISKGYMPSIGPAATAYGPGSLMLTYGLMRLAGPFDLVSFRMAWVAEHFLAVVLIGIVAYWSLGAIPAAAAIVLALTYSPLRFFYTLDDGTLTGFFGWANALRYCAPLMVVPAIAAASSNDWRPPAVVLLGAVWGMGAWLAQDSLTTTATAAVMLLTLLWLTETISLARALRILRDLVIGFSVVVGAVLVYYALHGAAGALLDVYFAYPRAITVGLGNAWWPAQESDRPDRISYYLTLPFLVACAICVLWRLPTLQLVTPLDRRRTRFLAFLCVQLVCYQSVLLWSDSSHLMSTMIALPFVLVLGFAYLPEWLGTSERSRWLIRVGFVAVAALVYPTLIQATDFSALVRPARRFQADSSLPQTTDRVGLGAPDRTRPLLPNEPLFLGGDPVSTGEFHDFVDEIRAIIGTRKTYCVRINWIAGGLIAFLADLTPAPHPPAGDLLTLNDSVRARIANHIRTHPQDYEAFVGPSLNGPEAQAFVASHPRAVSLERTVGQTRVFILLSQP